MIVDVLGFLKDGIPLDVEVFLLVVVVLLVVRPVDFLAVLTVF